MHTNSGPRYAIYFTPDPESALWRFGCAAIGYDAARACAVDGLDHPVLRTELAVAYREAPARYGFHATLKAPFALAAGTTLDDLLNSAGILRHCAGASFCRAWLSRRSARSWR